MVESETQRYIDKRINMRYLEINQSLISYYGLHDGFPNIA